MKIANYAPKAPADARPEALRLFLSQASDSDQRPCPACRAPCRCARHSRKCTCGCSPRCPKAAWALSSEPERYPIEPKAVPLVYALAGLRLMPPCWSCEGHVAAGGRCKLPQVWFYATSTLYVEMLAECLHDLFVTQTLHAPWEIAVSSFQADAQATTFILRPQSDPERPFHLGMLQQDLEALGDTLVPVLRNLARQKLARLSRTTPGRRNRGIEITPPA
ncbi:MAG TPA: hypothetical protein ENJ19_00670 [Gammaproteobacteria bacterium]|nr:hypothetical protein [Gammaproteobacteria bacterium]